MVQINLFGAIPILLGLLAAIWPYKLANLQESIDAIGSKRSMSEVEPADWMVTLTRIVGILVLLGGVAVLFGAISA